MLTTSLFSGAPGDDVAPSQHGFESTFSISQLFKTGAVASFSSSVGRQDTNSAFTVFDPAYTTSLLASTCGSPCSGIASSIPPVQPSA